MEGQCIVFDSTRTNEVQLPKTSSYSKITDILQGRTDKAPAVIVRIVAFYFHNVHSGSFEIHKKGEEKLLHKLAPIQAKSKIHAGHVNLAYLVPHRNIYSIYFSVL